MINKNKYVIISWLLFYDDVTVCSVCIIMVKVRLLFVGGVVFVVVLFF